MQRKRNKAKKTTWRNIHKTKQNQGKTEREKWYSERKEEKITLQIHPIVFNDFSPIFFQIICLFVSSSKFLDRYPFIFGYIFLIEVWFIGHRKLNYV